jgi:hypothetical protein
VLGEMLGEARGKITCQRVLPDGKVEASFQQSGKILGVETTQIATYTSEMRADGTLFGEGQGTDMTKDGDAAMWKASGVGRFTGPGAVSYRGAMYYQTTSKKLARLNSVAAVFEFETDEKGNTSGKYWEWK